MKVKVTQLGKFGEGIARWKGKPLYVDGARVGEVECRVVEEKATYARAEVVDKPEVVCPVYWECGGCQLMHLSYAEQLEYKRRRVERALDMRVEPCVPSPKQLGYRNKLQLVEGRGLYRRGTHEIVELDGCPVHGGIWRKAEGVRHLLVRTSEATGESLIVLVTDGSWEGDVEELMSDGVVGVVENINRGQTNTILGSEWRVLAGRDWMAEEICGLKLKLTAGSFFQVNTQAAELLYREALSVVRPGDRVVDGYCGIGILSLLARNAIGIESVPQAIESARENARLNGIDDVEFVVGRMEECLGRVEQADVVFLNPPRKGCDRAVLDQVKRLAPRELVYISCNPTTLAENMAYIGGHIESAIPFDLFPQTTHVETVVTIKI